MPDTKVNAFWFRRDLRLEDNAGLWHALNSGRPVLGVFIFDQDILEKLEDKDDARVTFIHQEITRLRAELQNLGSDLVVRYGRPEEVWLGLIKEFSVQDLYTNRDYEPYATERDNKIESLIEANGGKFYTHKDQVIFEKEEVTKDDGGTYGVFTPYSKKWLARLTPADYASFKTEDYFGNFYKPPKSPLTGELSVPKNSSPDKRRFGGVSIPTLESMGFTKSNLNFPARTTEKSIIENYDKTRDIPKFSDGTTRLSLHFRFGTISIRAWVRAGLKCNQTFLSELIWRDFYQMILWHNPQIESESYKSQYDQIQWRNNKAEFEKWCEGKTGFPIVDAGMRQLNETGYMHNRVRMITASFLCKDLLVDWRWGERYFARRLLDYDLAANNGGWQWAAGSGCDAAPYFRVFNPDSQQQKFDSDFEYIKRWVPEFGTDDYPEPMVDHKAARLRCLEVYKGALK